MNKIDLNDATLNNAHLNWAVLKDANVSNADLQVVNLNNANLKYCNLAMANLSRAHLQDADLTCAKLIGANLTCAYFRSANMQCVDLTNAILLNTNLCGTDLTNANLKNANLTNSNLSRATIPIQSFINLDLESIVLNKAINLSIKLKWEQNSLDRYLNHINNRETNSVLTKIDHIDKVYDAVKIEIVKQVISSLRNQQVDTYSITALLIDDLNCHYADIDISN